MASLPFVMLPPSEGKAGGGTDTFSTDSGAFSSLSGRRTEVITSLSAALSIAPLSAPKLLGVRGELLERAREAHMQLATERALALPAYRRYTGVVWDHLEPTNLAVDHLERVIVPSALLGATTGIDPVPDYRLKFSVSLPEFGRLDRWWRHELTSAIAHHVTGSVVIDMLPHEHGAAMDRAELETECRLIRVRFCSADGRRAVGHGAKAIKGIAARAALTQGLDALSELSWRGWRAHRRGDDIDLIAPGDDLAVQM